METFIGLATIPSLGFRANALGKLMKSADNSFRMNEQMKNAYEIGLKILKPIKTQMKLGLEIHRKSVVFVTYGFMPRATVDGVAIVEAINNNASVLELQDIRKDMPKMNLSMAWTNWPLFTLRLVQMGYSDNDIQKIIGGNALRVAKAALA